MNKQALRDAMRARRAQLEQAQQEADEAALARRILLHPAYLSAGTVMAYIAARGEIRLSPVIRDVLASGRRLVLPRCEAPHIMTARHVKSLDELERGAYDLLEPSRACAVVAPEEIDLILVPGTAFSRRGERIGQGGGYYDSFLPRTKAVRMGVCHDFALLECLDTQEHDQKMDAVCTPGALLTAPHHHRIPKQAPLE